MNANFTLLIVIALGLAVLLTTVLATVLILLMWRRSRREHPTDDIDELGIDVGQLPLTGPDDGPVQLTLYGTPVRLLVLVMAPVGRGEQLPSRAQLPTYVEQVVPGMMEILRGHQPAFKYWPAQVSASGFVQSFFNKVSLPGERGKNTPLTSVAGRINTPVGSMMMGLVVCAARPNGMTQLTVEHEGQWLDMLRIRRDGT